MDAHVMRHVRTALILTVALLGALAAWAAMPSSAHACKGGELCLWRHADRGGGEYVFAGNDGNLHNDLFARGVKVGDNATTVRNAGKPEDPSGLADVLAYKNPGFRGPRLCLPWGTEISNLTVKGLPKDRDKGDTTANSEPDGTWNDDISSFRWVANC
jgi:Peptidase inhibitor family I36